MPAYPSRDNGLFARAYTQLADLDPRLTDRVLDLLRQSGVAAYAEPTPEPVPDEARPTDLLWVDRDAEAEAARLLEQHLPGLEAELTASEDDAWAAIIAAFEGPSAQPPHRPESLPHRNADATADADATAQPDDDTWGVSPGPEPVEPGWGLDEHFEPPPPPPLPTADGVTRAAWIGLAGGPLYLVVALVLGLELSGFPALLAVGAFVAGFVTLVARMPERRDDDSDGGAVV